MQESNFLRVCQVRLMIMQTANELQGELEQYVTQRSKAIRLKATHDDQSEDWYIWDSIYKTSLRVVPILESRLDIVNAQLRIIEDLYTKAVDTGHSIESSMENLTQIAQLTYKGLL